MLVALAALKVESPAKLAVMLSVPAAKDEVVRVAIPPVSIAVPIDAPPLAKVTVSPLVLLLPALKGASVAVRVTD